MADEDSVDLSVFTAIEDDAAESLLEKTGVLDLSGLESVTDEVANTLSQANGDVQLPSVNALLFHQREGNYIAEQAIKQSGCRDSTEDFIDCVDAMGSICCSTHNDEVGHTLHAAISRFRIRMTLVKNRGHVDANVAEQLLELEEYSDEENEFRASPLSNPESGVLQYCTSIDDAASKILLRHEGNLCLNSLTSLSDEAAVILSEHNGELDIELENLSESAAAILRKHPSFADED